MLRLESETGWWLITHQEHAHLAAEIAARWGNDEFLRPEPREQVLLAIRAHDDGWAMRDAAPSITREGIPHAFSTEFVGRYVSFEGIDLAHRLHDYIAVRGRAVMLMAKREPYAAILISMYTCSLVTEHADRKTIAEKDLPLLENFLEEQKTLQQQLIAQVRNDSRFKPESTTDAAFLQNLHILDACDNISLVAAVECRKPALMLRALPLKDGGAASIKIAHAGPHDLVFVGDRHYRLHPYPFGALPLTIEFPARHIIGKKFSSDADLQHRFATAEVQMLSVVLTK